MILAPRASKTRRKTSRKPLRNVFYTLNTRLQRNNRAQRQKTPLPSDSAVSFPISELLPASGKVAATWETDWECVRDMGTAETRSLAPEQSEEPSTKARKNSNGLSTPQLEKLDKIRLHQSTQRGKLHLVM